MKKFTVEEMEEVEKIKMSKSMIFWCMGLIGLLGFISINNHNEVFAGASLIFGIVSMFIHVATNPHRINNIGQY